MSNNTFNVTEFRSIYTMIEDKINSLSSKSNEIESLCANLSSLVDSTDSNLSTTYASLYDLFNQRFNCWFLR